MTVIIDYDVGNLFSLQSSLAFIGEDALVSGDFEVISSADRIILPGVGAFGDAAEKLREKGMDKLLVSLAKSGKPLLGICLGMQLFFEKSFEYGERKGLGLLSGEVKSISEILPKGYKIPHIGWNALHFSESGKASSLLKYVSEGEHVYFVHSFAATGCEDSLMACTEYGANLTAVAARGNVFGTQFHPEKSGKTGLNILRAFCEMK